MTLCVAIGYGQCKGPIVADLVLSLKSGSRNVGKPVTLPLCAAHAIQGGIASWSARVSERAIWGVVKSIDPQVRKGLRLTHRVQVREPYKSALKTLGLRL